MKVLECFAGVGGNALAMKTLGFKTVGYCEINKFAAQVLKNNMRAGSLHVAPIYPDITSLKKGNISQKVDILAGGFPCKGLSVVGLMKGLYGDHRSALVKHMYRLITDLKPKLVFLENTPGLQSDPNFPTMLKTLNKLGYGRITFLVASASQVGAQHLRKRIFILAVRNGFNLKKMKINTNITKLHQYFHQNVANKLILREGKRNWISKICLAFGNCVVPAQAAQAFITLRNALLAPSSQYGKAHTLSACKSMNALKPILYSNRSLYQQDKYSVPSLACKGKGFHVTPITASHAHNATKPLLTKPFFSQCVPTFRTSSACAAPLPTITNRTRSDSGVFLTLSKEMWGSKWPPKYSTKQKYFVSDESIAVMSGFPKRWLRNTLVQNNN